MKSILSKNQYSYPLIIWSESDDHTKVFLASDKNTIKQIFELIQKGDARKLIPTGENKPKVDIMIIDSDPPN